MEYRVQSPAQLAQFLRSARTSRGLSQAELGERLGLSQSRIARMEGTPSKISVGALMDLLAALGARLVIAEPHEESAPARSDEDW